MENINEKSQAELVGNTKTTSYNQLYRWAFTLKAHISNEGEPDELIDPEFIYNILLEYCKMFYFQLEVGKDGGYVHYQGCFSLKTKHRLNETKNLLGFHNVHLEPIRNWYASIRYCTKLESRLQGPWNHSSSFIRTIVELRDWQQIVYDLLHETPDDRTIYWIYDHTGNKGKTAFCKYVAIKLGATILGNAGYKDIAFAINDPKIVIFNFTRSIEGMVNYSAIESIKDGLVFSAKYESKTKVFNSPHVIIFANFEPNKAMMSADRWVIYNLDGETSPLAPSF